LPGGSRAMSLSSFRRRFSVIAKSDRDVRLKVTRGSFNARQK
jgi:hypothetical protein